MTNPNAFAQFMQQQPAPQNALQNAAQPGYGTPPQTFAPPQQAAPQSGYGTPQQYAPQPPTGFGGAGAPPQGAGGFGGQQPQVQTQALAQAPQGAPALGGGFGLPDLSQLSESSGRTPKIPVGDSVLEYHSNGVYTFKGHTCWIRFTVIQSTNTMFPPGSVVEFMKKIPQDRGKAAKAMGFVMPAVRALLGFSDENTFKQQIPQWSQAVGGVIAGQPAEYLRGRRVRAIGRQGAPIIDSKNPPQPGTPVEYYTECDWHPVA